MPIHAMPGWFCAMHYILIYMGRMKAIGLVERVQQRGLEWELVSAASGEQVADEVLLTVVPWLTDISLMEELQQPPVDRFIAWPAIGEEPQQSAYQGNWITLSPSDMYCVERFGQLVDQALYRMVLLSYAQPITKIPMQALTLAGSIKGVHVDHQNHVLEVREAVSESSIVALTDALLAANSKRQAGALKQHNQGYMPWKSALFVKQR